MNKFIAACFVAFLFSACGINKQIDELKALEKCKYHIVSADSVYLANINVSKLIKNNTINLSGAPQLAFALFQKDLPLEGRLNIEIKNPGKELAGIDAFDYKVLIKDKEITSGTFNQQIRVQPNGGSLVVPLKIEQNIYQFIADPEIRKSVTSFLSADEEKVTQITLKIKPSLALGKNIQFPGYITLNKEISNKTLLSALKKVK